MTLKGDLGKMEVIPAEPVQYFLVLNEHRLDMNSLIGKKVQMKFTGILHCIACGVTIKKTYGQGFCYNCFLNSPLNSECIIRPELCEAHLGRGRDVAWEEEHHNQPHVVYLALTSGVKVGVTRESQVPARWIDQGAWKAIILAHTSYRQQAGLMEVELKKHFSDKTNWQKMLKNEMDTSTNLLSVKEKIISEFRQFESFYSQVNQVYEFYYPVNQYPTIIKSMNPEKVNPIEGQFTGIRGQYLMFDCQNVINTRNLSGYEIEFFY